MGSITIAIANEEDHDRYYDGFQTMVESSEYLLVTMDSEISKGPLFNYDSNTVILLF